MRRIGIFLFSILLVLSGAADAECPLVGHPDAPVGKMIYNVDHDVLQVCLDNGTWQATHAFDGPPPESCGGGLSGPADCPEIGDVCTTSGAGIIFAGWHPITHERLFIPPTDYGAALWKTSTGVNDIATDSVTDGRINTDQVPNSATFPAFKLCKDLTLGGKNDWYLPSKEESHYLSLVYETIAAKGNVSYQNSYYWSSTEGGAAGAWILPRMLGLAPANTAKNDAGDRRVRCLWR